MTCHDEVSQEENLLTGNEKVEVESCENDICCDQNVNEGKEEEEVKLETTEGSTTMKTSSNTTTTDSSSVASKVATSGDISDEISVASAKHCETVTAVQEDTTQENEVAAPASDDNRVIDSKVEELHETKEMKCSAEVDEEASLGTTLESTTRSQTAAAISKDEEEETKGGNESMINDNSAEAPDDSIDPEEALINKTKDSSSSCKDETTTSSFREEMENPKDDDNTMDATSATIKDTITTTTEMVVDDNNGKAAELGDCMNIVDEEEAKEGGGPEETEKVVDCCSRKDVTTDNVEIDDETSIATSTEGAAEAIDKLGMNGEEEEGSKNDEPNQGISTNTSENKTAGVKKTEMDVVNTEGCSNESKEEAEQATVENDDNREQTNAQSQVDEGGANVANAKKILSRKSSDAVDKEGMSNESINTTTTGVPKSVTTDINQKTEDIREETATPNMLPVSDTASKEKERAIDSSPTKKKAGFLRRLKQKLSKSKHSPNDKVMAVEER